MRFLKCAMLCAKLFRKMNFYASEWCNCKLYWRRHRRLWNL
jgi:hypothetical protein